MEKCANLGVSHVVYSKNKNNAYELLVVGTFEPEFLDVSSVRSESGRINSAQQFHVSAPEQDLESQTHRKM